MFVQRIIVVYLILFIKFSDAGEITGSDGNSTRVYFVKLNQIIDDNIETLQNVMLGFDPIGIPNIEKSLILWYFRLTKGKLENLSKISRSDNSFINYDNRVLSIDMNYEWKSLNLNYDSEMRWGLHYCKSNYVAILTNSKANIFIDIDLKHYVVTLKQFHFYYGGEITGGLKGSGITCYIFSFLTNEITKMMRQNVINSMEKEFTNVIQQSLDKLNEILRSNRNNSKEFTFVNEVFEKRNKKTNFYFVR